MSIYIQIYLIIWIILTIIGLILLIKERKNIILFKRDYVLFLLKKWKLILFLIAIIGFSYISTFGYDPSWDIIETIIMSLLTYYTAPYSIGVIYRYIKGLNKNWYEFYIGIILLFFSSAWFYDLYAMIFLLGYYPPMAFSNLGLSPFFYMFAGIMWNLGYNKREGVIFVYTKKEWIVYKDDFGGLSKILLYILPIILFMIVIFGYFIYLNI